MLIARMGNPRHLFLLAHFHGLICGAKFRSKTPREAENRSKRATSHFKWKIQIELSFRKWRRRTFRLSHKIVPSLAWKLFPNPTSKDVRERGNLCREQDKKESNNCEGIESLDGHTLLSKSSDDASSISPLDSISNTWTHFKISCQSLLQFQCLIMSDNE